MLEWPDITELISGFLGLRWTEMHTSGAVYLEYAQRSAENHV